MQIKIRECYFAFRADGIETNRPPPIELRLLADPYIQSVGRVHSGTRRKPFHREIQRRHANIEDRSLRAILKAKLPAFDPNRVHVDDESALFVMSYRGFLFLCGLIRSRLQRQEIQLTRGI